MIRELSPKEAIDLLGEDLAACVGAHKERTKCPIAEFVRRAVADQVDRYRLYFQEKDKT